MLRTRERKMGTMEAMEENLNQFSSVAQSCPTLCHPMNCSMPGLPVHHQLPEFTQTHVHWVGDAIQPSHPLLSPSPPAPNPSQHQGLFQWVNCLHQVAKVLEFQLQHQSFQWTYTVLGCNLKNDRMISIHFQGKPFNITAIQVYGPISNTKEAEVERFYEDYKIF